MNLCNICISETSFVSKCGCHLCLNCIISWFEEKNKMVRVNEIKCQCNQTYTRDDILQYCQEQPYQDRIQSILVKEYLKNNDIRSCPSKKCNNFGFVIEKDLCNDQLECNNCHTKWRDYSIATNGSRLYYSLQNFASLIKEFIYYLRTNECPGCGIYIQRNGGCKHMTCKTCNLQFCWNCKQNWKDHKEPICQRILFSFTLLLFVQPFILLNYLGIFSYFPFLLYPFQWVAFFLSAHLIVFGSIASVHRFFYGFIMLIPKPRRIRSGILYILGSIISTIVTYYYQIFANYYFELNYQGYINCFLFDLTIGAIVLFFFLLYFTQDFYLSVYPFTALILFYIFGFLDGVAIMIWMLPSLPVFIQFFTKLKIRTTCILVGYSLLLIFNIFSLWNFFTSNCLIGMIAIDFMRSIYKHIFAFIK